MTKRYEDLGITRWQFHSINAGLAVFGLWNGWLVQYWATQSQQAILNNQVFLTFLSMTMTIWATWVVLKMVVSIQELNLDF